MKHDTQQQIEIAGIFSDQSLNIYQKISRGLDIANKVGIGCGSVEIKINGTLTPDEQSVTGPVSVNYLIRSGWSLKENRDVTVIFSTPEIDLDKCTEQEADQFMDLTEELQALATRLFIITIPGMLKQEDSTDDLCDWLVVDHIIKLREMLEVLKNKEQMAGVFDALNEAESVLLLSKYKRSQKQKTHAEPKSTDGINLLFAGTVPLWIREAFSFDPSIKFGMLAGMLAGMPVAEVKEPDTSYAELGFAIHSHLEILKPTVSMVDYKGSIGDVERVMQKAFKEAKPGKIAVFSKDKKGVKWNG